MVHIGKRGKKTEEESEESDVESSSEEETPKKRRQVKSKTTKSTPKKSKAKPKKEESESESSDEEIAQSANSKDHLLNKICNIRRGTRNGTELSGFSRGFAQLKQILQVRCSLTSFDAWRHLWLEMRSFEP